MMQNTIDLCSVSGPVFCPYCGIILPVIASCFQLSISVGRNELGFVLNRAGARRLGVKS